MRINSIYSTLTHQPLVLLQQDISYSQFLALLSVAEVFMATNLREGMNLTSHDFIHCQDGELGTQQYGSLILSEFTGSARIFQGHPLLVNPWDYKQCANAINTALEMPTEQKKRNWEFLLNRKSPHTALAWYSSLQSALKEAYSMQQSHDTHNISLLDTDALRESYSAAQARLFFLEDDATFSPAPCVSSPSATDTLQALAVDPRNTIYLTSNRSPDQLNTLLQSLPAQIGLIAENGCFIKSDPDKWEALVDVDGTRDWRAGIRKVSERTEGSIIEVRPCSPTFNYDAAFDADTAAHQSSELVDQVNGVHGSEAIPVVREATAVSVEPLHVSKATAALKIMDRMSAERSPDFIFVAGGASSDEALFRWANRLNLPTPNESDSPAITVITLTAGAHATEARARLPPSLSLLDLLRLLVPGAGQGESESLLTDDMAPVPCLR